jgi:hypothetical protein
MDVFVAYFVSCVLVLGFVLIVHCIIWVILDKIDPHLCPKPLPGPTFPWHRCSCACRWCDYIEEWEREPQPVGDGPYRTSERT